MAAVVAVAAACSAVEILAGATVASWPGLDIVVALLEVDVGIAGAFQEVAVVAAAGSEAVAYLEGADPAAGAALDAVETPVQTKAAVAVDHSVVSLCYYWETHWDGMGVGFGLDAFAVDVDWDASQEDLVEVVVPRVTASAFVDSFACYFECDVEEVHHYYYRCEMEADYLDAAGPSYWVLFDPCYSFDYSFHYDGHCYASYSFVEAEEEVDLPVDYCDASYYFHQVLLDPSCCGRDCQRVTFLSEEEAAAVRLDYPFPSCVVASCQVHDCADVAFQVRNCHPALLVDHSGPCCCYSVACH